MYKPLTTTKAEMIAAIEKLAQAASQVPINQMMLNIRVGALQSFASHLPETEVQSVLDLKIARILKECLSLGGFDDCLSEGEEIADIEEWVHEVFIRNKEEE